MAVETADAAAVKITMGMMMMIRIVMMMPAMEIHIAALPLLLASSTLPAEIGVIGKSGIVWQHLYAAIQRANRCPSVFLLLHESNLKLVPRP